MADDLAQGFNYQPGRSTTSILYNADNVFFNSSLPWRPFLLHALFPLCGPVSICSSSSGFIICRVDAISNYYIGNPFAQHQPCYRGPLVLPPTYHPPHDTNVVLAVESRPGAMFPIFHVICAIRRDGSIYDFHTYSSTTQQWAIHPGINLWVQREIVPNTGVSCGRFAYWLTQNPCSVLSFDIANSGMISFLELPRGIRPAEQVRMQLGRSGDSLGLVIVSETKSTVELYTRPYPVAENMWERLAVVNVEIQADANRACRVGEEFGATLVCTEMPRPMRFESFKMEPLFWVWGEVVMLEGSTTHRNLYNLLACPAADAPATIIDSLPHVCNPLLPLAFEGD